MSFSKKQTLTRSCTYCNSYNMVIVELVDIISFCIRNQKCSKATKNAFNEIHRDKQSRRRFVFGFVHKFFQRASIANKRDHV